MNHIPREIGHEKHRDWASSQVGSRGGAHPGGRGGVPSWEEWGADGAAVGLALCASPFTRAPPAPGSWQPPAMWSPRSSSTGSADTSTSRSSISERRPWGGVGGAMGVGVRPESPCPIYSGGGQDTCPGLPGGPGRGGARVRGYQGTVFSSLFPTMPRHNYRRVAPLVKALCAKHGLSYEVKPFLTALVDIVR